MNSTDRNAMIVVAMTIVTIQSIKCHDIAIAIVRRCCTTWSGLDNGRTKQESIDGTVFEIHIFLGQRSCLVAKDVLDMAQVGHRYLSGVGRSICFLVVHVMYR
jgi:hypothetical protein